MATFRKRANAWQALVRRRGYPDTTKTFQTKQEAEQWTRSIEAEMDRVLNSVEI